MKYENKRLSLEVMRSEWAAVALYRIVRNDRKPVIRLTVVDQHLPLIKANEECERLNKIVWQEMGDNSMSFSRTLYLAELENEEDALQKYRSAMSKIESLSINEDKK